MGDELGSPKRLFRETTRAWIDCTMGAMGRPTDLIFLADGTFLWPSERTAGSSSTTTRPTAA